MINGRKWWTSGACDPRCKILIFMGLTNPDAPRHQQHSMILVPVDPGVKILRPLPVFGYDDAHGHAEVLFENVRVPYENVILGEAAVSRSPRGASARAASTTACAPSAWPSAPSN